ncbi:OmpH family outer membrane protein [Flavivirga rizhaonensis]|uniref:OmpH family outer membrane protein n=1 Tax=Flavivirga rizhaonensis TaxID=2559571 RepID=A0A4S1DSU7_9FLAO|nr:OmpH family outer membrane protein [Flavivirga rizhaonensis]TGV01066.1 OmpH family outer membrane protein [Flavivirga rizhaonensis]
MTNLNRLTLSNTILIVIIIIVILINYLQFNNQKDIVYIDNIKLFNGFNMTKDIKVVEEAKIRKKGKELDSLYAIFQTIKDKENNNFKSLQQQIAYKSKAFQELQDNYSHNLSENIWNRLNNYIKEYAQTNNLKIILGTSGNGNVMFAQESIDLTDQILEFSNRKYEGNN